MSENVKTYQTEKIKVHFNADICSHAAECVSGLPSVFNVNKRPWISPQNATPEEIMRVIDLCPSGALSYEKIDE